MLLHMHMCLFANDTAMYLAMDFTNDSSVLHIFCVGVWLGHGV